MPAHDKDDASTRDALPLPRPLAADDYEAEAARARIAARMFGAAPVVTRIGRYEVGERIGAGGMGVVFSARDPELGRMVALKLLTAQHSGDPRHRQRLIGEAQSLARLSHPNVVQIYEVGEHDGATFLALELIQGETLTTWQRRGDRRWQEILAAYVDAARGLAAAHQVGVVHRDVKPSNILVSVDGRVRVVDFGLARATPEAHTTSLGVVPHVSDGASTTGAIAGTPAYMSPEQAGGRVVDARSDIFSLAVCLFEALHATRPFDVDELVNPPALARLLAPRMRERAQGRTVPAWITPILAAALEPDVQRRTRDLREFIASLEWAPRRRRRRALLAGAVIGLGLGGWGVHAATDASPVCPALVDTLPDAWDPAHKQEIHARFLASGLPFAEEAWRQTERAFDAAVLAWGRERRSSCLRTHVDHSQSSEQFDLAAACLTDHERALRERVTRLAAAGANEVTQAHALVRELRDPSVCTDTAALRRGPSPPPADAQARVVELRRELESIRILADLAEYDAATERIAALSAAATIHGPLHAEALHLQGIVAARRGMTDDAARWFTSAAAEAEAYRDDRLAAAIAGEQTELATRSFRDPVRARVHAAHYAAKLRRTSAGARQQAEHLDRLGELELIAGDPAAALAHHEAASRLHTADDPLGRARNMQGVANALADRGRVAESIEQLQAVRDLLAAELGVEHPRTAAADLNLALSLYERPGRRTADLDHAADLLRGALAVETRHGDEVRSARVRTVLALVLHARGDLEPALVEVERAIRVLQARLPPTHGDLLDAYATAMNLHIDRRAWAQAEGACNVIIRIHRARGGPIPLDYVINAGEFALRQGDTLAAIPWFDQALTTLASEEAPDPILRAHALNGRAKAYLEQGDAAAARGLLEQARSLVEHSDPPGESPPQLVAEVAWHSARALAATGGDPGEIRRLATVARTSFREHPGAPELAAIDAFISRLPDRAATPRRRRPAAGG